MTVRNALKIVGTCSGCGDGWDYPVRLAGIEPSREERHACSCGRNRLHLLVSSDGWQDLERQAPDLVTRIVVGVES